MTLQLPVKVKVLNTLGCVRNNAFNGSLRNVKSKYRENANKVSLGKMGISWCMSKLRRELFFSSDFQGRKVFISFEIPEMQWVFVVFLFFF